MELLGKLNYEAHKGRPLTPQNKKITLWKPFQNFIHCCIESKGCRFSRKNGACIMCDYGIGYNITPEELRKELEVQLCPYVNNNTTVLFGTYGSILDTDEISEKCFDEILDFIVKREIHSVIFETHCSTINENILKKIHEKLQINRVSVTIEMGYESCDEFVLKNCLNKFLNLAQLCSAIMLIHKYSMKVSLNVLLGAPFLSEKEQLDTAVQSVNWAFDKGADSVVVFPCNIKPFTLLFELYKKDFYKPVSQWLLVELLSRIPTEKLSQVTLSWYGDRKNFYENDRYPLIPPTDCEECHAMIFEFYHAFMKEPDAWQRRILIDRILHAEKKCNCHDKVLQDLYVAQGRTKKDQIISLLEMLN